MKQLAVPNHRANLGARSSIINPVLEIEDTQWRRDWDSNPGGLLHPTCFPGMLLKPLGHLSANTSEAGFGRQ